MPTTLSAVPQAGQPAPDFTLPSTSGQPVTLSALRGKNVLLAFFPLAFTSVCTAEMCDIRDDYDTFASHDVVIVPISVDSVDSLREFKTKHGMKTDFASDFKRDVSRLYGTLLEDKFFSNRAYFLVDRVGVIRWAHVEDRPGLRRTNAEYWPRSRKSNRKTQSAGMNRADKTRAGRKSAGENGGDRFRRPARSTRSAAVPSRPGKRGATSPLSRVAVALAGATSLDRAVPAALRAIGAQLRCEACEVWVNEGGAPRRAWSIGTQGLGAPEATKLFRARGPSNGNVAAVPLRAQRRLIGVLAATLRRPPTPAQRRFFEEAATLLAPFLVQIEVARAQEEVVEARTLELQAQRQFFEGIVDTLPVGLYVIDRSYRVRAWNRKRESGLLGVKRANVLGRTIFDVLHRQPADVLRQEFDDLFRTGRIQQFQTESESSGERRVHRLTKVPMRTGNGEVTHAITVGEDITDWKLAEERIAQAEKLAALGTLAAGVMHEINNPLATIAAAAEALETKVREEGLSGDALSHALADTLRIISEEVHRSKAIVNGVLEFSRSAPAQRMPADVNALVDRTLFLLGHHPRFKQLTVATRLAGGLPMVLVNDEQMIQVLMALLLNAMDAMAGRGTVTIRTHTPLPGWVAIDVVDPGGGIRRADLPRIFEPFFTTKPVGRGTGLGLSVCYPIVVDHGGRIDVRSAVGKGSTFSVVLPAETGV